MIASVPLDDAVDASGVTTEIAELFRAEYRSLVRLATLLVGDRATAEEVVQEAFVKLQLGWRRIREPERAPAWLRSAVLNGARSPRRSTDASSPPCERFRTASGRRSS